MVKGNPKSSATSATRKKHLKKHAKDDEPPPNQKKPKIKGERGKKKEPRVKMYIPPVKPAPVQPDPLETTGLAHTLPADLLVVLRNISKKAQVTKTRALEELQATWVNPCLKEDEENPTVYTLIEMLPVWLHHVSALFINPSRRVRLLTASLHSSLLQIPLVREQIIFFLRETASSSQLENILGTWCLATYDVDKHVSGAASGSWKATITPDSTATDSLHLNESLFASLNSFVQRVALDPSGVYIYLNPLPPPPPPPVTSAKKGKSNLSTPRRDDGDQTPRSKQDEQEESEQDRKARLRIAALGALRWIVSLSSTFSEEHQTFYSNPAFWTVLHPSEVPPWAEVESFGHAQPIVRKAGWVLLQALLASLKDNIEPLVSVLSTAVLRSAWVELDPNVQGAMWQPLLTFLKQYPKSWELDASKKEADADDESGSESEEENEQGASKAATLAQATQKPSQAYQEFLQFLQLGCSGSPIQGYPTVVIIISTIPSSILLNLTTSDTPLADFFSSFWAAVEGRALSSLHRIAASAAFLGSLLECLVFLIKRMRNDSLRSSALDNQESSTIRPDNSATVETSTALTREQFSLVWEQLSNQRLRVEDRAASRLLAQSLEALSGVDLGLLDAAWDVLVQGIKQSSANEENVQLVSAALKVFHDRFKKGSELRHRAERLLKDILLIDVERCEGALAKEDADEKTSFELLVNMLGQFREGLFSDENFATKLDVLLCQHASRVLSLSPSLILSYLVNRKNEAKSLQVWHSLLSSIASTPELDQSQVKKSVIELLHAAQKGQLPKYLKPQSNELDALVGGLLEKSLAGPVESDESALVSQILVSADYFLSKSGLEDFFQVVIATFTSNVIAVIEGKDIPMSTFDAAINLIDAVFANVLQEPELSKSLLPDLFLFTYLVPATAGQEDAELSPPHSKARDLWSRWIDKADEGPKEEIGNVLKARLREIVKNPNVAVTPEAVLSMVTTKPAGLHLDILHDLFPTPDELESMLQDLSPEPIDASIAVLDPLIPPSSRQMQTKPKSTDRRGFSAYARIVTGLLHALVDERWLAKRNMWALRHFLALSIYAQDLKNVPSEVSKSPVFDDRVTPAALLDIITKVKQLSVYLFNSMASKAEESWRTVVLDRLLNESARKTPKEGLNGLQTFLLDTFTFAKQRDATRDTRALKMVLDPLLADGIEVAEADLWIQLARKFERTSPQTSITIVAAITSTGAEPPKLDRYRNELAAGLLGIKPQKANSEGLLTLRKLAASAPLPESDVIFLPPPRAVNVVKGCQAWVLAEGEDDDEELDEEVQSVMLPIFMHLAPILQNVPGAHWAFIFDVLEAVLESSSGAEKDEEEDEEETDEGSRLLGLARALKLVIVLEDLTKTNKSLRAEWNERRTGILTMIRDLQIIGNNSGESTSSAPRSACRELALSIVQHLPPTLIDQDTLSKMCHLVEDPSPTVQKMAYQLLKAAAKKRTEHFVIEAGVDTEDNVQPTLPTELLEIILQQVQYGDSSVPDDEEVADQASSMFGHLLGWMLVFDLFQDVSFKVKSSYIEQLRNLNVVADHFIPTLLGVLRIGQGISKAFKLDIWAVDRFYVDLYEPGRPHSIPVLTAHVYYRALLTIPSLVHSWVLDCKDRQLIQAFTAYTSTYFSPVLIQAELEHVRSHATADGVADDNLSVKVATAVNEVTAAYSVDEHQLEIKLKIPNDWPLHRIEVRDVKRVGVDENRWRAWVLGVQQTIWAHNGRIIDGLGIFKKNVTLHFEGQVECAICYSIISVMDGSLPKKPCKTCRNRFHAACLYKWFNTSHSSSCPLCRSDII